MGVVSRCRALFRVLLLSIALAAVAVGGMYKGMYLKGEAALYDLPGSDWRNKFFLYSFIAAAGSELLAVVFAIVPCVTGDYQRWSVRTLNFFWGLSQVACIALFLGQMIFYYQSFGSHEKYRSLADLSPWVGLIPGSAFIQAMALQYVGIYKHDEYVTVH